jgi:hypothetical protein
MGVGGGGVESRWVGGYWPCPSQNLEWTTKTHRQRIPAASKQIAKIHVQLNKYRYKQNKLASVAPRGLYHTRLVGLDPGGSTH